MDGHKKPSRGWVKLITMKTQIKHENRFTMKQ
jgi:hypothetical protein